MIELERDESQDIEVWADGEFEHVIVQETVDTFRLGGPGPGWYVRDVDGEEGAFPTLERALVAARIRWVEVSLAPANRLRQEIAEGRADEVGNFLLEYLATYGPVGIDAQALARRVFERIEEE